jgi:adenine deaminase
MELLPFVPDNHEITNVFGLKLLNYSQSGEGLPLRFSCYAVCVPSISGFEDAVATITAEEVAKAYEGLGSIAGRTDEFPWCYYGDPNTHAITAPL